MTVCAVLYLKSNLNQDTLNQHNFNTTNKKTNEDSFGSLNSKKDIEEKKIYGTFKSDVHWANDPAEPKNLLEISDDISIIRVKVKSVGDATFLPTTEDFDSPHPYTPIEVIVEDFLYGSNTEDIKTVYMQGGFVKIADIIEKYDQDKIEKMDFDTLSEEDKKSLYVLYETDYDYVLQPNGTYVLIVTKYSNNIYTVVSNGYGVFKQVIDSSEIRNVLTGKVLTDLNGKALTIN